MTARPILFTPGNAQKVHDGVKTQTRRIVKDINPALAASNPTATQIMNALTCPYGTVGDRLYVKEGLCRSPGGLVQYRSDLKVVGWAQWQWKSRSLSPMFMPKEFARTWLELTGVCVERVQECSSEDAVAEGAADWEGECELREKRLTAVQLQYAALWDSIHGKGSWDLNPWVWVLTYKRVPR